MITSEAEDTLALTHEEKGKMLTTEYTVTYQDGTLTLSGGAEDIVLTPYADASDSEAFAKLQHQPDSLEAVYENGVNGPLAAMLIFLMKMVHIIMKKPIQDRR